ncbi:MAG: GNAT family N-acetyltransferase [Planctomycetota bacterium]
MTEPVEITTLEPVYFEALAQLQIDCYPTLDPSELMTTEHFAVQHEVFADGQFVALLGGEVVGMGSGFFCDFDFENTRHRFREFCDNLYFRNHDPDGAWYYGADISVHPDLRRRGIGRALYQARQQLVTDHEKAGIVGGGLIPGYADHKDRLDAEDYVRRVVAGELHDPTLTFQLRSGFRVRGLLADYLEDEASDNWATLLTWEPS